MFIPVVIDDILKVQHNRNSPVNTMQVMDMAYDCIRLRSLDSGRVYTWNASTYANKRLEVVSSELGVQHVGYSRTHWLLPTGDEITKDQQFTSTDWLWNRQVTTKAKLLGYLAEVDDHLYRA